MKPNPTPPKLEIFFNSSAIDFLTSRSNFSFMIKIYHKSIPAPTKKPPKPVLDWMVWVRFYRLCIYSRGQNVAHPSRLYFRNTACLELCNNFKGSNIIVAKRSPPNPIVESAYRKHKKNPRLKFRAGVDEVRASRSGRIASRQIRLTALRFADGRWAGTAYCEVNR